MKDECKEVTVDLVLPLVLGVGTRCPRCQKKKERGDVDVEVERQTGQAAGEGCVKGKSEATDGRPKERALSAYDESLEAARSIK